MPARVQYSHPQRGINITKALIPPKTISSLDSWFRAARKTIPEIPQHWYRDDRIVTRETIVFELI